MDFPTPQIAALVRRAVRVADITHAELAEAIGISRSTVHRRLSGERVFTANDILAIANVLQVPVESLLPVSDSTEHAAA